MDKDFLSAYVRLLVRTCHRRGAHAIGGMAAQIPIKDDAPANAIATAKVRADKEREVCAGHDGTWVAHPGLVGVAKEVFDSRLAGENQIGCLRDERSITAQDLLAVRRGSITEQGLRTNIDVGIQYLEAWLRGVGAVPLYNLMEDAATAEICRAQVWQWIRHGVSLADGRVITRELVSAFTEEELAGIRLRVGETRYRLGRYADAAGLFEELVLGTEFQDFLTLTAYNYL
jgi:malate synthase